jgi:hypothetical protein
MTKTEKKYPKPSYMIAEVAPQLKEALANCNIDPESRGMLYQTIDAALNPQKMWIVVSVYKGCLETADVFSDYQKASEHADKLKRTKYKGVTKETEMQIHQREIDKPESLW